MGSKLGSLCKFRSHKKKLSNLCNLHFHLLKLPETKVNVKCENLITSMVIKRRMSLNLSNKKTKSTVSAVVIEKAAKE